MVQRKIKSKLTKYIGEALLVKKMLAITQKISRKVNVVPSKITTTLSVLSSSTINIAFFKIKKAGLFCKKCFHGIFTKVLHQNFQQQLSPCVQRLYALIRQL